MKLLTVFLVIFILGFDFATPQGNSYDIYFMFLWKIKQS